jgi:hypothetical protein
MYSSSSHHQHPFPKFVFNISNIATQNNPTIDTTHKFWPCPLTHCEHINKKNHVVLNHLAISLSLQPPKDNDSMSLKRE